MRMKDKERSSKLRVNVWVGHSCPTKACSALRRLGLSGSQRISKKNQSQKRRTRMSNPHKNWLSYGCKFIRFSSA
jgi:hypothetical protein